MDCGYFDTTRKGSHSSFLAQTVVGGRCPFPVKHLAKVTHPLRKTLTSRYKHVLCRAGLTYNNCRQLHNILFGRRHSTPQSHGLSAIAELLIELSRRRRLTIHSMTDVCQSKNWKEMNVDFDFWFCVNAWTSWFHFITVWLHVMQRAVLSSQFWPSVCPSVRLSVRCVYCDKTE